jgi:predicted acyl esterase
VGTPVRIYVMGAEEWRDLAVWPPGDIQKQRWYLQPGSALATDTPPGSPPSQYRYDPADPTPNIGGATNATFGRGTGAQDNRALEARPDVLTFSSQPLRETSHRPVAEAVCHHRAYWFFVRLCVHLDGKSANVMDCCGFPAGLPQNQMAAGRDRFLAGGVPLQAATASVQVSAAHLRRPQ